MVKYFAILRGINVGGKRKILMADLKTLFSELGFANIQTYIQSGNVLFDYEGEAVVSTLEDKVKAAISSTFSYDVPVIIRTITSLKESIANNPFYSGLDTDIGQLHLTFLQQQPAPGDIEIAKSFDYLPDKFELIGQDVFLHCVGKYHKTKYSNNFFERKLKVTATTRNWKTVLKLLELGT